MEGGTAESRTAGIIDEGGGPGVISRQSHQGTPRLLHTVTEGSSDGYTDRGGTDTQTHRQTDGHTDRDWDRHTDRQTDRRSH